MYILYSVVMCMLYTCVCSTMHGRNKGTDSSINSILGMDGIYRTGREFIEPEEVRKHILMPSLYSFLQPFFVLQTS